MVKSDRDHALKLLEMARGDHAALTHMLDRASFSEEIFGFHAQQTIEKALKAWIASLGLIYPKTHDLSVLTSILRQAGGDLGMFRDLEDYTVFAVQYRYESYDKDEEMLDRPAVLEEVTALLAHVHRLVADEDL